MRAAVAPVVALMVVVGAGFLFHDVAAGLVTGESAEVHGRHVLLKAIFVWVLKLLGPTGVAIMTTLCSLGTLWWFVRRIQNPPIIATLNRSG